MANIWQDRSSFPCAWLLTCLLHWRQMTHDPSTYPDPWVFKPERFLAIDGQNPQKDPRDLCFGFGRRICPGGFLCNSLPMNWVIMVNFQVVFLLMLQFLLLVPWSCLSLTFLLM